MKQHNRLRKKLLTKSTVDESLHPTEIPLGRRIDLEQLSRAQLANKKYNFHEFPAARENGPLPDVVRCPHRKGLSISTKKLQLFWLKTDLKTKGKESNKDKMKEILAKRLSDINIIIHESVKQPAIKWFINIITPSFSHPIYK